MAEKEITYLGYYDTPQSQVAHFVPPAGSLKMRYVAEAMASSGRSICIWSAARPISDHSRFFKSESVRVSHQISAYFFPFFYVCNRLLRKFCSMVQMACLLFLILRKIGKGDVLVVYHSLAYASIVFLTKAIKKYHLILEVEEIYDDVKSVHPINVWLEKKLFSSADAYIFPSELIDKKVNVHRKPSIIIYGNYHIHPTQNEKWSDGKVHVIYSGTFNQRKGGVDSAIRAGEFLDANYHIHITGWGTEAEIEGVKETVKRISEKTACMITYDGYQDDQSFIPYLQQFNIGLSTQNPDDKLSSSCFPSKILLYMCNGLTVLSSKAPAVLNSQIASDVFFYERQTPIDIAAGIKRIPIDVDSRKVIEKLDVNCKHQMKRFLQYL